MPARKDRTATIAGLGEVGLLRRLDGLLRREGVENSAVTVGIGDDCAAFRPRPGFELLVTCDAMVEGRHFLPKLATPFSLGRRAMAMNVSDVGAMGGLPRYALVSLGLKGSTGVAWVEELYRGFLLELNPLGASIIGGNLTKTAGAAFLDVTLIGEVEPDKLVRRSTARPGDAILLTGYPGQAAAGLELLRSASSPKGLFDHPLVREYHEPAHRAREGRAAAESGLATAMIDTSDGLLGDLGRLCQESGVGAELVRDRLPVSAPLREAAAQLSRDPLGWVLGASDDYELILTCRPEHAKELCRVLPAVGGVPVAEVGRVTGEARQLHLLLPDGQRQPLAAEGWDHFAVGRRPRE